MSPTDSLWGNWHVYNYAQRIDDACEAHRSWEACPKLVNGQFSFDSVQSPTSEMKALPATLQSPSSPWPTPDSPGFSKVPRAISWAKEILGRNRKLPFLDIRNSSILTVLRGCTIYIYIYIHSGRKLKHTMSNRTRQSPQETSGNYKAGKCLFTAESGCWVPHCPSSRYQPCWVPGALYVPNMCWLIPDALSSGKLYSGRHRKAMALHLEGYPDLLGRPDGLIFREAEK